MSDVHNPRALAVDRLLGAVREIHPANLQTAATRAMNDEAWRSARDQALRTIDADTAKMREANGIAVRARQALAANATRYSLTGPTPRGVEDVVVVAAYAIMWPDLPDRTTLYRPLDSFVPSRTLIASGDDERANLGQADT
jgi:hypothetical protein